MEQESPCTAGSLRVEGWRDRGRCALISQVGTFMMIPSPSSFLPYLSLEYSTEYTLSPLRKPQQSQDPVKSFWRCKDGERRGSGGVAFKILCLGFLQVQRH